MHKIESEIKTLVWGTEEWFRLPEPFDKLLFKVIDAKERLSVQVHPNDEYAQEYEGSLGKTEAWYILDAQPKAKLVYGLDEGVGRREFERAIEEGTVEECLNFVPVKKGDMFFIPAGMVHAIGGGIKLAELQENSEITYRVYDYNREPKRELHVQKALEVIDFDRISEQNRSCKIECKYFVMEEIENNNKTSFESDKLIFSDGELYLVNAHEEVQFDGKILVMGLS